MKLPISEVARDRLLYFLKGDKHALLFCLDMLVIAHTWDDLIDKDKMVSQVDINGAFIRSLGTIPTNPFYQAYQVPLASMMLNALTLWLESNELAGQASPDLRVTSYVICHAVVEIIHFCILAVGDIDWLMSVQQEFWEIFGPTFTELSEAVTEVGGDV